MKLHISKILLSMLIAVLSVQFVAWPQSPPGNISVAPNPQNNYDIPPERSTNAIVFDVTLTDLSSLLCYGYDFSLDDGVTWSLVQPIPCFVIGTYIQSFHWDLPRGTHTVHVRLRCWFGQSRTWSPPISSASTIVVLTKYHRVNVQNSFGGGSANVDGGTYVSGSSFTWAHGTNRVLEGIDAQNSGGYVQRFDTWSGPGLNPPTGISISISVIQNATYTANFDREFNITFQNSLPGAGNIGVIKVMSAQYNSPTSSFIVRERNIITGEALYQVISGIEYTFSSWSPGGSTSASTIFCPDNHTTYTANFTAKPQPPPNVSAGGAVGSYVQVTWTSHPHGQVTQYQIWRKVKQQGDIPTLLTTVGQGTTSFTDYDYKVTDGYTHDLVSYDVRSYFSVNQTYSDPNWVPVFARQDISAERGVGEAEQVVDLAALPMEYSLGSYPNPFNPSTTIRYTLPHDAQVKVGVFDLMGREIARLVDTKKNAGMHQVIWHGVDEWGEILPSGIYLVRMRAESTNGRERFEKTMKIVVMK